MQKLEWESSSECNQSLVAYHALMRFFLLFSPWMKTTASWTTKLRIFDLTHSSMGGNTLKQTRLRPPIKYFFGGGGEKQTREGQRTHSSFKTHLKHILLLKEFSAPSWSNNSQPPLINYSGQNSLRSKNVLQMYSVYAIQGSVPPKAMLTFLLLCNM